MTNGSRRARSSWAMAVGFVAFSTELWAVPERPPKPSPPDVGAKEHGSGSTGAEAPAVFCRFEGRGKFYRRAYPPDLGWGRFLANLDYSCLWRRSPLRADALDRSIRYALVVVESDRVEAERPFVGPIKPCEVTHCNDPSHAAFHISAPAQSWRACGPSREPLRFVSASAIAGRQSLSHDGSAIECQVDDEGLHVFIDAPSERGPQFSVHVLVPSPSWERLRPPPAT
jgi:hypothetical protein